MVRIAISKAARTKHLQTILIETMVVGNDWKDVLRADIDELVYKIIETNAREENYRPCVVNLQGLLESWKACSPG